MFNHLKGITYFNQKYYIADSENHIIRAINATNYVTTFSGTGYAGKFDGPSDQTLFNYPTCLVADSKGNLFVAEFYNCDVRKISPDGSVETFAGSSCGYRDGYGVNAKLSAIFGIAIDENDDLWIAEYHNNYVRKILHDTRQVITIAGSGVAGYKDGVGSNVQFTYPAQINMAKNGDILMADSFSNRIRRVTRDGVVSTVAGTDIADIRDGYTDKCFLKYPIGVIEDPNDSNIIYVTEYGSTFSERVKV